ncbi:MAG: SRPBCC domain-containing protein [Candidatus Thorarchaeota archaeon]|nr:MAG: SRPBCC domain-containing protein [Candidatus Thorarchaeota archaeon]
MADDLIERSAVTDGELVFIREFGVPKSLVYQALTEHDHIKKWKGPKNFHVTFSESELKVGGKYSYGMQPPEGSEFVLTGEYKEIDQPDKLVYTQSRLGAAPDGGPGPETEISITLKEHEGKTTMEFHHAGFPTTEFRDRAIHGWNQTFEKLENHLNSLL